MGRDFLNIGAAIALLTLAGAVSTAAAVERCVLVELMTLVNCPGCPYAEAALDSLTEEYPDSALAIIRYHPSSAPANPFQVPDYRVRWKYYDRPNFPSIVFDGGMMVVGGTDTTYNVYKDSIEVRLQVPSPLSMSLSVFFDAPSRMGQAQAQIIAVDSVAPGDLHLRCVLLESGLDWGDEVYEEVFRAIMPDSAGVSLTFTQGDTIDCIVPFTLDSLWLPENCALVAFVQEDATKEVLQSTQRTNSEWIAQPPIPAAIADLQVTQSGSQLYLSWSAVTEDWYGNPLSVDYYRIFGEASRYVEHGIKALIDSTAELFYLDGSCGHVGDLSLNCSYYVTAVAGELESNPSNVVGEFDFYVRNVK
jgi:hypothetical protein